MNFLELAQTRHTTKAYDQTKKIPHEQLEQLLLEVLRLSPSSINIQPWRFLVAQSGKQNKISSKRLKVLLPTISPKS